jgi:Lrp/AsnC family leucine-responsive transcriptional regulator
VVAPHEMKQSLVVAEQLTQIPQVQEIHNVIGEDGLLVKIRCADNEELGRLLEQINFIEGVRSTKTTIVFHSYKETLALPLNDEESEVDDL